MRIVIDTNVVISAVFFGGIPRRIIEAVMEGRFCVCGTVSIIEEYEEVIREMIERKQGTLRRDMLTPFIKRIEIVNVITPVGICRDPDDDKFISCAIDARAKYIVSGDKDLLVLEKYRDIEIITAHDFDSRFLESK